MLLSNEMFKAPLCKVDAEVSAIVKDELKKQRSTISLIASENLVSAAVMEAQGTVFTNKYAEGYPGHRYYDGCEYADAVESLAIERAKKLFGCAFANVQPHSGSQANQGVFFALLNPHDKILGLSLDCGGHLTHGSKVNQSGKWFDSVFYKVHTSTSCIDYEEVQKLALEHKPKLIIAGCSAYPRYIDFEKFRKIADSVDAYLLVDMAHFAGLVVADLYDNPVRHAHVVTTTTHKTLRGPRGGMILTNDPVIAKAVNSAIFPGIQGGPLMHVIAAKAVAFGEALRNNFKTYMWNVVENAKAMSDRLIERGCHVITNGTDSHLLILDLRPQGLTGDRVSKTLSNLGLICNKNAIPFDTMRPTITSGVRIGTPWGTTRGFGKEEFLIIADLISDVIHCMKGNGKIVPEGFKNIEKRVIELCKQFPIY